MSENLTSLLGRNLNDPALAQIISSLGVEPEITEVDDRYYYEFKNKGLELVFDEDLKLRSIHLYPEGRNGYSQYRGDIPNDITFTLSRSEVHQKLGEPSAFGGGKVKPVFGVIPRWDLYEYPTYSLHVEYLPGENGISLITLMPPKNKA